MGIPILSFQDSTKDSTFEEESGALNCQFCIKTTEKTFKKNWSIISRCITGYENTKRNRALSQNSDSDMITIEREDFEKFGKWFLFSS